LVDRRAGAGYAARWTTEGTSGEKTVTEAEWWACTDPEKILKFLEGNASERKLRLFACACVRRAWHLLTDTGRQAVEAAEAYADDMIGKEPLRAARSAAYEPVADAIANANMTWTLGTPLSQPESATDAALGACDDMGSDSGRYYAPLHAAERAQAALGWTGVECATQAALLRDIFGNPFRRPLSLPESILAWNDGTGVKLAQAAYDERHLPAGTLDNGRLAVLADALDEAGCSDADILGHLRGPGPHVRGCWPVDLCFGKS
jgi:hypothetical protein